MLLFLRFLATPHRLQTLLPPPTLIRGGLQERIVLVWQAITGAWGTSLWLNSFHRLFLLSFLSRRDLLSIPHTGSCGRWLHRTTPIYNFISIPLILWLLPTPQNRWCRSRVATGEPVQTAWSPLTGWAQSVFSASAIHLPQLSFHTASICFWRKGRFPSTLQRTRVAKSGTQCSSAILSQLFPSHLRQSLRSSM